MHRNHAISLRLRLRISIAGRKSLAISGTLFSTKKQCVLSCELPSLAIAMSFSANSERIFSLSGHFLAMAPLRRKMAAIAIFGALSLVRFHPISLSGWSLLNTPPPLWIGRSSALIPIAQIEDVQESLMLHSDRVDQPNSIENPRNPEK